MDDREIDLFFASANRQILEFASAELGVVVNDDCGRRVDIATVEEAIFGDSN